MTNIERFAGKSAEEILATLKAENETAAKNQEITAKYEELGISRTRESRKVMVKLPGNYPVVQTRDGWLAIQALLPMILKAHDELPE